MPPPALLVQLALAVVLDTAVHLLWKVAVLRLPETASVAAFAGAVLGQPLFLLVAVLFVAQFFNWLKVLESADLSYAQPITSLSLISVVALSALFLGEGIDAAKIVGIGLIMAGVWFISRSGHDGGATLEARR